MSSKTLSFKMEVGSNPQTVPVKYKLKSEEGVVFFVDRKAMKASAFINQYFIDKGYTDRNCRDMEPVPIPFPALTVELLVTWLNHHQDDTPNDEKVPFMRFPPWDKQFFRIEPSSLFSLLNASHNLGIEKLMNMGCCAAAEMIRGKSTAEIRKIYNIKADKEEEAPPVDGAGPSSVEDVVQEDDAEEESTQEEQKQPVKPKQSKPHKKSKKSKKKRH